MTVIIFRFPSLTTGVQFLSQESSCEICGEESDETSFTPSTYVFPTSIIPPTLRTQLHLHVALTKNTWG